MKKEELNYYDCFIKDTEIALRMTIILKEYVENFDYDKSKEKEKTVHDLEREADNNTHKILKYLVQDFLPPIDREDVALIANKMDDIIDDIDSVVINIDILDVKEIRPDFIQFIKLIYEICQNVGKMMNKLKTSKKYEEIDELVVAINKLEGEGDKIYESAVRNLFINETNAIEILKWHKMYQCVEQVCDSCEGLANTIGEVIMKNL